MHKGTEHLLCSILDRRVFFLAPILLLCAPLTVRAEAEYGPLFHEFHLTLAPGHRTEVLGPLFYDEQKESTHLWALPPLFSYTWDHEIDFTEWDFVYPVLTYDRYGSEYRFHIFQLFSFAGGKTQSETNVSRFTLFPIYFQQRSAIPEKNYTAVVPLYGHLKNRLFRDEIKFVMMPIYVESRKKDVVTDNYVWPFFHLRHGDGLTGWQFWPFYGTEHKEVTSTTNHWGDIQPIGGHDKTFVLWPFYFNQTTGIGTTNPAHHHGLIPFYASLRSPLRDSTSYGWPIGVTHTIDRERKYTEWAAPWPLIVFDRGEGKTTSRVWPFFSQSHNTNIESDWYLWPVYKYKRVNAPPLDYERTRILFFLYSDTIQKNTEAGEYKRRADLWPFYTWHREFDGNSRLQILAILEPFLPASKSIERDYSPLWSLWRAERNPKAGASSQSLLWNLYRRDVTRETKKCSLLFGLFRYQSGTQGKRWRVLYIPFGKKAAPAEAGKR